MKTRTLYRVLEGIFLFILILMIYTMSIFSAKGQMARELSVPFELTNSYTNELSFVDERIMKQSTKLTRTASDFHKTKIQNQFEYVPDYLKSTSEESISNNNNLLPNFDLRRRKLDELLAPSLTIPLN